MLSPVTGRRSHGTQACLMPAREGEETRETTWERERQADKKSRPVKLVPSSLALLSFSCSLLSFRRSFAGRLVCPSHTPAPASARASAPASAQAAAASRLQRRSRSLPLSCSRTCLLAVTCCTRAVQPHTLASSSPLVAPSRPQLHLPLSSLAAKRAKVKTKQSSLK